MINRLAIQVGFILYKSCFAGIIIQKFDMTLILI